MRVLLVQLDGVWPNVALMRLSAHHKDRGDEVVFWFAPGAAELERGLFAAEAWGRVYGSLIFEKTRPLAERLRTLYPGALVGGTGWDFVNGEQVSRTTLEEQGVTTTRQDYTIVPSFTASIGFTQRGCRLSCSFCVVPRTEGRVREVATIADVWRGEPWPRHVALLDNDFTGAEGWRDRVDELVAGGFRVCFTQGLNVRTLKNKDAEALARVDYRDHEFKERRLYCAWDNRRDEFRLFAGLWGLVQAGVKPDHLMVYVLVGYDHEAKKPRPLHEDDIHRVTELRAFGARPFPMPYVRPVVEHKPGCACSRCVLGRELVGFQRWVVGSHDKRIGWPEWSAARFQPRLVHRAREAAAMPLFGGPR